MTRSRFAIALIVAAAIAVGGALLFAATDVDDARAHDCAAWAPPPTGVSIDAAREAHRRASLRQRLREREAVEPGFTLRTIAASADQRAIDRGEVCVGELYETGRILFEHAFTHAEGLPAPFHRVQLDRQGGPETNVCTSCHWRGGVAGAGGFADDAFFLGDHDRISSGDARNPPSLVGAGAVQALAAEMSAELADQRTHAIANAKSSGAAVAVELVAKGVQFGTLHVDAHGKLDTRDVHGVDPDLVVRPFGWKGTAATIVDFIAESSALHFGLADDHALTAGQLTALSTYVAALELPISRAPEEPIDRAQLAGPTRPYLAAQWAHGRELFESAGCSDCHRPSLVLARPIAQIGALAIDLSHDAEAPRVAYDPAQHGYPVFLFSDLKRHDLGPDVASRHVQHGVSPRLYLTRRLWGLGDSAPYFHDGASTTIDAAVARHGGEAVYARDNWSSMPERDRDALRTFLVALRRETRLQVP